MDEPVLPESAQAHGAEASRARLRRAVAGNANWYHSIELAPGVVTPGHVDLRGVAPKTLPANLAGRRALDVGTFDGFWAFEMERRGASVVAIDVDGVDSAEWPLLNRPRLIKTAQELDLVLGRGFRIAAEALGSRVERVICDVYDLEPDAIGGEVDDAFVGALLLHLRDPVGALEQIHSTLKPGGRIHLLESVSMALTVRSPRTAAAHFQAAISEFNWWLPNIACVHEWLRAAGFVGIERKGVHRPPSTQAMRQFYVGYSASRATGG